MPAGIVETRGGRPLPKIITADPNGVVHDFKDMCKFLHCRVLDRSGTVRLFFDNREIPEGDWKFPDESTNEFIEVSAPFVLDVPAEFRAVKIVSETTGVRVQIVGFNRQG